MKPTESGWYWLKTCYVNRVTDEKTWHAPYVVYVCMDAVWRRKQQPMIYHVNGAKYPLSECGSDSLWEGPLVNPFGEYQTTPSASWIETHKG